MEHVETRLKCARIRAQQGGKKNLKKQTKHNHRVVLTDSEEQTQAWCARSEVNQLFLWLKSES